MKFEEFHDAFVDTDAYEQTCVSINRSDVTKSFLDDLVGANKEVANLTVEELLKFME